MHRWFLSCALSLLAMGSGPYVAGQNWDFVHEYRTVYASNALAYVVEQANMTRISEGNITYWSPLNNGTEGRLTQKFVFPRATDEAVLTIDYIYIANFGVATYGYGSLWGSKDGTNWIRLIDAPRPTEIASGYSYSTNLPPALLGSKELWFQARLQTQGWNIMAQFLRYDTQFRTNNAFSLKVNYATTLNARQAVYVDSDNLRLGARYQMQISTNMVDWADFGEPFQATNTYWRTSTYWDVQNESRIFFRLRR